MTAWASASGAIHADVRRWILAAHTRCCLLMARPTPMQDLLSNSVPTPTASSAPPALPTPDAIALFIQLLAVLSACAVSIAHACPVLADHCTCIQFSFLG